MSLSIHAEYTNCKAEEDPGCVTVTCADCHLAEEEDRSTLIAALQCVLDDRVNRGEVSNETLNSVASVLASVRG